MSKLSFRARALDASKPMPIYMAEELPDLPDYSAINRAVPQMPSGMEKEEECEHHLQRAICAGLIIPTPEVSDIPDQDVLDKLYPANYKQPRQLIHMQPFTMEQDIPDYDMDSDDERWLGSQTKRLELSPYKFEEMMDRLEKSSGQTVVTLNEAKALLKEDDDLIIAVFDYWLNKRLKLQHPLILSVKTEQRPGIAQNNPYLAFRRRTEKMQTRKNRKNDETSYEKMLKLRRDLSRAVTLLDFVKRREKMKREFVHLTIEILEKRFHIRDFNGAVISELSVMKIPRPAFTPIFQNHYANQNWSKNILKDEIIPRKEKRQYKKRKHKSISHNRMSGMGTSNYEGLSVLSSDEEPAPQPSPEPEESEDEGQFAFRRNKLCNYHKPKPVGNWPWCSQEENGSADTKYRFTLTSISSPRRCIGFARRRIGRGGRVILDRITTEYDDFWRTLDFTVREIRDCAEATARPTTTAPPSPRLVPSADDSGHPAVKDETGGGVDDCARSNSSTFMNVIGSDGLRTSCCENGSELVNVIKQEPEDVTEESLGLSEYKEPSKEERDDMVEILQSVRREWLHFRPKTPPADYEPPCYMLPPEDPIFLPSANAPFALELRSIDDDTTVLAENSTFVTNPFLFEDMQLDSLDVPVTDTRQCSNRNVVAQTGVNLNVNVGIGTLNATTANAGGSSARVNLNESSMSVDDDDGDDASDVDMDGVNNRRTAIGCSKFTVSDISGSGAGSASNYSRLSLKSTLISPKLNSVNVLNSSDVRQRSADCSSSVNSANGIIPQFGMDVSSTGRTKINEKLYAYSGETRNSGTNTLSIRAAGPTVTLNSHSANILEIPITNDTDTIPTKVVASHVVGEAATAAPANNKNKTIVCKNNLVMEVT